MQVAVSSIKLEQKLPPVKIEQRKLYMTGEVQPHSFSEYRLHSDDFVVCAQAGTL